jgi:HSP20 family molecular chaperone IbpA
VLPPADIFEDEAGFTVIADLPGVSKERLAVRIDGDSLVIEGAASAPVSAAMALIYGEMQNPFYCRSFTLSRELDPGKIQARLTDGVLKLSIPKAEKPGPAASRWRWPDRLTTALSAVRSACGPGQWLCGSAFPGAIVQKQVQFGGFVEDGIGARLQAA